MVGLIADFVTRVRYPVAEAWRTAFSIIIVVASDLAGRAVKLISKIITEVSKDITHRCIYYVCGARHLYLSYGKGFAYDLGDRALLRDYSMSVHRMHQVQECPLRPYPLVGVADLGIDHALGLETG